MLVETANIIFRACGSDAIPNVIFRAQGCSMAAAQMIVDAIRREWGIHLTVEQVLNMTPNQLDKMAG